MKHAAIGANSPEAQEAIRRWDELKSERGWHEQTWEDLARLIRPQRGGFGASDLANRKMEKPLSSAPIMAQINFASGLYGTLTNPANKWLTFRTADPDLNKWQPMKEWLSIVSDRVLASYRPSVSPFYDAAIQLFSDISTFGNAPQYDEIDLTSRKIMDVTVSLAEVVWDIDWYGQVVEVVRCFKVTPRAAVRIFTKTGDELPQKVHELAEKGDPGKITFYQHVKRNETFERGKIGVNGKQWSSAYACEVEETLVRKSGYDEMPFYVPRWEVDSGHTIGTGPGFTALASARVLHRMDDATIRAAQFAADPTILAPDRETWPLSGRIRPGSVVYGGMSANGQKRVGRMDGAAGIGLTIEEKNQKIEEIRDAFHYMLMNLAGRTGMTATEVMAIQEEKLRLMAPHSGRIQHEYLSPKNSRRFSMLWRAGQLPPPPQGVPRNTALEIEYTSAAALAQKSAEGAAVMRLAEDIGVLAAFDPTAKYRLDGSAAADVMQEARGAPAHVLRSAEEAAQLAKAEQEAARQTQQMQMMQQGGMAIRDMAQAGASLAGAQGGGQQ